MQSVDGTTVKSIETTDQAIQAATTPEPPKDISPIRRDEPKKSDGDANLASPPQGAQPSKSKRALKKERKLLREVPDTNPAGARVDKSAANPQAVNPPPSKPVRPVQKPAVPPVAGPVRNGPTGLTSPPPAQPKDQSAPAPDQKPKPQQKPAKAPAKPDQPASKEKRKKGDKSKPDKPQVPKGPDAADPPAAPPAPAPVPEVDILSYLEPKINSSAPSTFEEYNKTASQLRLYLKDEEIGPKISWINGFQKLWLERPLRVKKGFEHLASEYEVNFSYQTRADASTHPIAHFVRSVAEREAICRLMKYADETGARQIVDLYGSERICIAVNDVLTRLPEQTKFTWFRPLVTAKDHVNFGASLLRRPSLVPTGMPVLVEDCYIPKDKFFADLSSYKIPYAIVITQIYRSESMGGMMHGEGPFWQKEGKFIQAASATDPAWEPCESNDWWLSSNNYAGYAWDVTRQYGDFYVIAVRFLAGQPLGITETLKDVPLGKSDLVVLKRILPPTFWTVEGMQHWWKTLGKGVSHEDLYVLTEGLEKFSTAMVGRNRQTFQMATLTQELSQLMNQPKYSTFCKVSGIDPTRLLRDTVTWITWNSVWEETSLFNKVLHSFGETVINYRNMKTKMVPVQNDAQSFVKYWGTKILLITVMFKIVRFFMPFILARAKGRLTSFVQLFVSPTVGSIPELLRPLFVHPLITGLITMTTTAVTPYMEEKVKSYLEPYEKNLRIPRGVAFGTFESALYWWQNRSWHSCIHLFMHALYGATDNPEFTHALWNCSAFTTGAQNWPELYRNQWVGSIGALAWSMRNKSINGNAPGVTCPGTCLKTEDVQRFQQEEQMIPAKMQFVTQYGGAEEVEAFRKAYDEGTNTDLILSGVLPLTLEEASMPYDVMANPAKCPIQQESVEKPGFGFHVLLGVQCLMRRPFGVRHFYSALEQRNLKPIPALEYCENPKNPCVYRKPSMIAEDKTKLRHKGCKLRDQWQYAVQYFCRLEYYDPEFGPLRLADWVQKFKGSMKRQRAAAAVADRSDGILSYQTKIFLKSDEVLWPKKDGYIKPRLVKAVNPTIQACLAKPIDSAMRRLKTFCDGQRVLQYGDSDVYNANERRCEFRIAIGSGKTAYELSQWYQESLHWVEMPRGKNVSRYAMIVAGDDFFCIYIESEVNVVNFVENDFSSFDRTQGVHALEAKALCYTALGVSACKRDFLFEAILTDPIYENSRFELKEKIRMPPQCATGGPDTTLGNTVLNITSVLYSLRSEQMYKLAGEQSLLGFTSKIKFGESSIGMTFLKGWWVPLEDHSSGLEYAWLPLPSQVIKLGKIMTHPEKIFPNLSADEAWRSAAKAMAAGLRHVPREYPILGALLLRYDHLIKYQVDPLPQEAHKVLIDLPDVKLDLGLCLDAIEFRYGLDRHTVYCMEQQILDAPFPSIIPQEGFWDLGTVDYS
jgi:hypothetical protein